MKALKILFFSCLFSSCFASDFAYTKLGTEIGLGYRRQLNHHGFDCSINATSMILINWYSLKAYYLNYPISSNGFYLGIGGAMVLQDVHIYKGGDFEFYHSVETLLGYQFTTESRVKPFVQLGVGAPITDRAALRVVPSFTVGFGF